jgi:thiamine kinase-like enzyme
MKGQPLPWFDATLAEIDITCRLVQEGIAAMHRLTERIRREDVAKALPERTMLSELEGILQRGAPWLDVPLFSEAVRRLLPILGQIDTPLVFSNGDYNPLNFLWDGERLSGWIDFTGACFEDPHISFAKFVIWAFDSYGWGPGARAGLVERYLYAQNVSRSEFAPRLSLRCLWRLQRDTSVTGREDAFQRDAIVEVLREALASLS